MSVCSLTGQLLLLIEIGIYFQSNACQIFFWNIMAAAILVHWNLEIVLSANLEIKIKGLTNARGCSVIQTGNRPHHSSLLFCPTLYKELQSTRMPLAIRMFVIHLTNM